MARGRTGNLSMIVEGRCATSAQLGTASSAPDLWGGAKTHPVGGVFVYGPVHVEPGITIVWDAEPGLDWRDRVLFCSGQFVLTNTAPLNLADMRPGGSDGVWLRSGSANLLYYHPPDAFWVGNGWDGTSGRGGAGAFNYSGFTRSDGQFSEDFVIYADNATGQLKIKNGAAQTLSGALGIFATEQAAQVITSGL